MPIHRAYEPHNVVFDVGSILEGWNPLLPIGAHLALYRTELLPFSGWFEGIEHSNDKAFL
jgi:hypothetical protein